MKPKYFDNHAHLNFAAYDGDREDAACRTLEGDVWVVNVGTKLKTSISATELASKYDEGVYATVGLHPVHTSASFHDSQELGEGSEPFTSSGEVFDAEAFKGLARDEKVLGIGETGLDYFRLEAGTLEVQRRAFLSQINLSNEVEKPLMLHIRPGEGGDAYKDAYEILKSEAEMGADVHFFAGSTEDARRFLDLGYYISFTGVITFARDYKELVDFVPLERILSETDCPYVTPVPHRGERNEPFYVKEVVSKIAEIKGLELEKTRETLLSNALKFWGFRS